MGILTRPLLFPQERYDKEDFDTALSALRADSHFYTKRFLANQSYILQGFTIDPSQIGANEVAVTMTQATLINGNNTADMSWWTAPEAAADIVLTFGAGGLQPGRNYLEAQINAQQGTPLQRTFWDPSATGGVGVEYTQEVNTVVELAVDIVVNQTGFSIIDPSKLKVGIIDCISVMGGVQVTGIQDRRELFFRLATSDNLDATFPWTRQESTTTIVLTTPSVMPFIVGETVTFTGLGTATVVVGGTNNIQVFDFQSGGIPVGSGAGTVAISGAGGGSGIIQSYYQIFTGADKDIQTYRDMFAALMNEIRVIKGTRFWWEIGSAASLPNVLNYINTLTVPKSAGAYYKWKNNKLFISDSMTSGMATSDVIAAIRIPGFSGDVFLTRQDDTGGSAALAIPDQGVLWVKLPTHGVSRSYSESGSADTNYQVSTRSAFSPSDHNYILAYREGDKLVVLGAGELKDGEQVDIDDNVSEELLQFVGAESDTSTNPQYTTLPTPDLAHQMTTGDSLTQGISIATANINDLAAAVLAPYQEILIPVGTIPAGTSITLPVDSRNGGAIRYYKVGAGGLWVFLNGVHLTLNDDITEIGISGTMSNTIQLSDTVYTTDKLEFRIVNPQSIGTAALDQPFFINYLTGQTTAAIPTGALYNSSTNRLQVFRNGLNLINSLVVGDPTERYTETSNNAILLGSAAAADDVFTMLNHASPNPTVATITGLAGTVLTVPTYVIGNGTLQLFRNGILLSADSSAPTDLKYTETTTSSVTLAMAFGVLDIFTVYISSTVPQFRESLTGVSGINLTFVNPYIYGDKRLCVFKNGVLMFDSVTLGNPGDRYLQILAGTGITLQDGAVPLDFFEIIYI